ncbi:MAG: acyl carrier protein [Synechococcaceae cyanobacterium RL_1_2]|jgi:acyl carrier protein|nr:acyl carrier protein [Synechococcaceae cyanobacterium RL_1_2]
MAVFDDVKEVIAEELELDAGIIKPESVITGDLGADSLDVVELIMKLEEKFDLEIPDEEAEKLITVEDVVKFVESQS